MPIRGDVRTEDNPRSPSENAPEVREPRRDPRALVYVPCQICSHPVRLTECGAEDEFALCQTCGPWELSAS